MPAREIKTTLAVDGEQAYKRAINDAKTSVRNLGTQLSLAQAEFKKSGDAQKLMETRAKALKSEIDQQNEIVKSLDNALKDAVKQYGEGSKEAEKWGAELNRAKATMASLEAELANNERGLDRNGKAFDDASTAASDFGNAVNSIGKGVSFELITSGIGKITSGFENAIKKAADLATSMWNMMRDAASWADDEITLAKIYGVDVEDLQRMQHAAKMVDVDIDTIVKARQKLMKAMGSELKSDSITEAFQALRVPVYDQNGSMREMETVFWEAGRAMMNLDDEVLQNNVAMQLFGKSWMELRPLFEAGSTVYKKAMEEATVVPQENIEKLGSLQDQLDRLDDQFNTLKMNVLSELAPSFEILAGALTDLMGEFNAYLQTDQGKEMMAALSEAVSAFFSEVKNIDLKDAVGAVSGGLDLIKDGFIWIKDNKDSIVEALKGIGLAFAGLKLVEVAANMGKIAWGFKQLFGGGGNKTPTTTPTGGSGDAGTTGGGWWVAAGNKLTQIASNGAQAITQNGLNTMIPVVGDMFINQTNMGRALRDGGNFWEGLAQDVNEKKEEIVQNASTFEQDWRNNALLKPLIELGDQSNKYWTWYWGQQQKAAEYDLGDHVTAEEAMDFVKNGGEVTMQPEKVEIVPDDNWAFGDDASIEDIMNWMNSRNGGSLTPGSLDDGVSTGVYSTPAGGGVTGDALTSQDIAAFGKVPGEMALAVGQAVKQIRVQMDKTTVGYLVAPVVSDYIAANVRG